MPRRATSKVSAGFLESIRGLIAGARETVARGVALVQVYTNFEIGRRIVQEEQRGADRAAYGEQIVSELAKNLTNEFGRGFSTTNLKLMRLFYLENLNRIGQTLSDQFEALPISRSLTGNSKRVSKGQTLSDQLKALPIAQTLSGQLPQQNRPFSLGWSHYVFLLTVKDPDERSFYEIEATSQNWSVRELKRQFDSGLYERLALSRDKEGISRLAREGHKIVSPRDLLKEPLVLEFLGLDDRASYTESDLESAVITQLERFLLELGKGFLFEARQKRFTFDSDHFFVDLVFYNRLLRCYVLLDLKIGKLTHQDLGQMQMYVNYFDRHMKTADEKPTIGIVLCKLKNQALVEITLPKVTNIHAGEYQLYLPSKAQLRRKLMEAMPAVPRRK